MLLSRLGLPFECVAPGVDETAFPNESARDLVWRLSESKARAGAAFHPGALVIGSDQVAVLDGKIIGKPGDYESAVAQLRAASGQSVEFLTGLCLFDSATQFLQLEVVSTTVVFRPLCEELITRYLHREQPYQCAGSFRSEGLGVVLCERFVGDDPNALIGLPLIRLVRMLEKAGVQVLERGT